MVTRERTLQWIRLGIGHGALTRPRQAATAAALVLLFAGAAWFLTAYPWSSLSGSSSPAPSAAEITQMLSRSGYGPGGSDVRVLWATPDYFRFTQQQALAARYDVERNLVFFMWENIHDGDLPEVLQPVLRVDGGRLYLPARVLIPANAVHHRFSVALFPRADARGAPLLGESARSVELLLPLANAEGAQSILTWYLPLQDPQTSGRGSVQFTGAAVLALLGGVLASMWPCLFQLTAYFIPTLAGVTLSEGQTGWSAAAMRLQVARTAGFFILGFVIVYTLAGVAAGMAAQSLDGSALFWTLRRPLTVVAGVTILIMALRLAANARTPLACRMPLDASPAQRRRGDLGTMLLGLAFATGCTTCFGAALILGIVAYAGLAGTPLLGGTIMLLFSLGMAIPLMVGALAMARALRVIQRLERLAPYMILASSAIMAGFAVLLLSGQSMGLSNWIFGAQSFLSTP